MKCSLKRAMCALLAILFALPLAAQTISGPPAATYDARQTTASASLRHIGNRVGIFNQKSGSNTRAGFRTWEINYVAGNPSFCFANMLTSSSTSGVETGTGGSMGLKLYVEYLGGTTALTWGGATSGSIANGGWACTDPSPVYIPAYTKYRICGDMQMGSGGTIPTSGWSNAADGVGGDEYQIGTTSDFCASGTALAKTPAQQIFPTLILGVSDRTVWGVVGDSIVAGVNYTQTQINGGRGVLAALASAGPNLNYGVPGDRAAYYVASSTVRRAMMAAGGVTAIVDELGFNDINNGRTATQLAADRATIRGFFPGINVYETTVTPATSSTDLYKTAANQTLTSAANNTEKNSYNSTARAGISGVAGLLDFAAEVETSAASEQGPVLNGGLWIPSCMYAGDGVHMLEQCERQKIYPIVRDLISSRK